MLIKLFVAFSFRFFLFSMLVFGCQPVLAEKTDIVYLKNGDRITGEVKSLTRGKLEFKTDHMGTVFIEWENILQLTSPTGQAVELTNGQRFYGTLAKPENENMVMVSTPLGVANVDVEDVFLMYPVASNFWERLDVNVDFGLSWDKGSKIGKYSLGVDAQYRHTKSISRVSVNTEITTQDSGNNTQRSQLSGLHNVFRPNKQFVSYFADLESNDQLGIDLRTLAGAGYGWVPVRSQRNWLSFALGMDVNREIPSDGEAESNLEGVGWLTYEYYKFSSPERSFKSDFLIFPGITDWGRWRARWNTNYRLEIVNDLFWKMGFYANYDNKPISVGAAKSDYGLTTSIGYKF